MTEVRMVTRIRQPGSASSLTVTLGKRRSRGRQLWYGRQPRPG